MAENKNRQQVACDYIRDHYVAFNRLRYDSIAQKVQIRLDEPSGFSAEVGVARPAERKSEWHYLTTADINSMVCNCCIETGTNVSTREIMTVLNAGDSYIPHVHPLREYIESLSPYTQEQPDWIDMVAQQVTVEPSALSNNLEDAASADRMWRICFKKWFVAMVASWLDDNIVNHQVLVLIGKQGIFKTTWLERLIPPQLRNYCCKLASASVLSKDDRMRIAEFGLINMDELDALNPKELNVIKSVITASDINERAAYGLTKERRIRLASFCASSNKREFLTDITGNRRWLPFEVVNIQNPFYTIIPYKQVYAQAKYLIENDFNYWFDLDDIQTLEKHNEAYRTQDSEEQLLPILFDIPAEGCGVFMTTAQISERLVSYGGIKKPMTMSRLGMLLGRLGYKNVQRRINMVSTRGWIVYQRDTDEINAIKKLLIKE